MAFPAVTYTFSNSTTADASQVNQNFTDLINGFSDGTKSLSMSAATFAGTVNCQGNVTLGASSSNTVTINASLASTVNLNATFSYDIGTTTIGVRAVYFGDAAAQARCTKIVGGTIASGYTMTLPTAVAAGDAYALESTSGGVLSFVNRRKTPTVQTFTSGSGTYTTPAGVLYIRIRIVAGGGGGGGSSNDNSGGTGGTGGSSTFGTSLLTCTGGTGGANLSAARGTGGSATMNSPAIGMAFSGSNGQYNFVNHTGFAPAVPGGPSPFGGSPVANSGAGGVGDGGPSGGKAAGSGGSGAYIDCIINSPSATYSYGVGAAGTAGTAGTSGATGGAGSAGLIFVEEFYQ